MLAPTGSGVGGLESHPPRVRLQSLMWDRSFSEILALSSLSPPFWQKIKLSGTSTQNIYVTNPKKMGKKRGKNPKKALTFKLPKNQMLKKKKNFILFTQGKDIEVIHKSI